MEVSFGASFFFFCVLGEAEWWFRRRNTYRYTRDQTKNDRKRGLRRPRRLRENTSGFLLFLLVVLLLFFFLVCSTTLVFFPPVVFIFIFTFILLSSNKFSAMIDEIGLQQPAWKELTTTESALGFASMGEPWWTPSYLRGRWNPRISSWKGRSHYSKWSWSLLPYKQQPKLTNIEAGCVYNGRCRHCNQYWYLVW